jgi:enoyl-CoA hydratase/carnithine racemase
LLEAFTRAEADPDTNVVLLRAEGRSFCSGYDIEQRNLIRYPDHFTALPGHNY